MALWIVLIVIISLGLVWFQYANQLKNNPKRALWFVIPRLLSYCCIGLLLLNLSINSTSIKTEKQDLVIGVDNSISMAQLYDSVAFKNTFKAFIDNESLLDNFKVNTYSFANDYTTFEDLKFDGTQTNINKFLTEISKIYRQDSSPTLVFTDGQQTIGQDYSYNSSLKNKNIIPVIVGDTTNYNDLKIDRINANTYAFLNNQFPVEVFLSYNAKKTVETEFILKQNNKIVSKKNIVFNANNTTTNFKLYTKASQLGVNTYTAELVPVNEKNKQNNTQKFAVEVIDERTKILMLYDNLHPDVGMFKKSISTNLQKEVSLKKISDSPKDLAFYNLIILYQPNEKFKTALNTIFTQQINHVIITGTQTDYNLLNQSQPYFKKSISNATESFYASQNKGYSSFQQEDLNAEKFPPLKDIFGEIVLNTEADILYYQNINGFSTNQPLIMTISQNQFKSAFIFGENMWRWRMASYVESGDFTKFDKFIDQLLQFTSSSETKKRLVTNIKSFYNQGENNLINVQYFDRNYVFDPNQTISLIIKEKNSDKTYSYALNLKGNNYTTKINDIKGGDYEYNIKVEGEKVSKNGSFKVIDFMIEKTFYRANKEKLESFSDTFFYIDNLSGLKDYLTTQQKFKPIQKSIEKQQPLINWKILLGLIIVFLSIEWFSRKYYGLI